MPRFYFPALANQKIGDVLILPAALHHHLWVLRLKVGASLVVFASPAQHFGAVLLQMDKHEARVRLETQEPSPPPAPYTLSLIQALPEGKKMDWIIEKAVELGVAQICPVISARSVVQLKEERAQQKVAHWQAIAVAATEQSGQCLVPTVQPVRSLKQWLEHYLTEAPARPLLLLHPNASVSLLDYARARPAATHGLLVGPEGGWSPEEIEWLENTAPLSVSRVHMGHRILRTETAALVALAQLRALWE